MPRKKFAEPLEDVGGSMVPTWPECSFCLKTPETMTREGAIQRQAHYRQLGLTLGLDALQEHLAHWLPQWYPQDPDRVQTLIADALRWVANERIFAS